MSGRATHGLALATAALLAGCGAAQTPASAGRAGSGGASAAADAQAASSLRAQGWRTDFARHAVPLAEFRSGGPPRDGIPPIDHPRLVGEEAANSFLSPREPVIAVELGRQVRAYPLQILVWHEIVNDVLGGRPISVTYCPLCNSAVVYGRRIAGQILSFGTTGMLRNSDLVMWDRQTQSWWQQFDGRALVGSRVGQQLTPIDSQVLSWQQFRARYPNGSVLSRDTGFQRPYGSNPYVGYEGLDQRPFLYAGRLDPRLRPTERVVAVFARHATLVVAFARLERDPVFAGTLAGQRYVVFFSPHVVSALDAAKIGASKEVGTAGVFDPELGGRALTFRTAPGGVFVDAQTGSSWDLTGRAVAGRLSGRRLTPLRHDEQFWFALAAFIPNATLAG